jgi:uncharacterized protein YuzE
MSDTFDAGKHGAIVGFQFGVANATTEQTATDLATADISGNTLITMPKSGSVVGISVNASAEVTAGTVTFAAHKDSTEFAQSGYPNPGLSSAAAVTNESYASVRPGVLTFSAGEAVGVSYTSSTDMAPTDTNDFSVVLFVQFDPN